MFELNKIYLGNCVYYLNEIVPKESVDLTICSPPYKNSDEYSEGLMIDFLDGVYKVLKPNSLLFLNFGHLAEDKFRPFRVCQIAMERGFKLNETFIWIKNHYRPIQGNKRVNNLTEFIFLLYKGKMPKIDRLSVGIPYVHKSNIGRYSDKDLKCAGNIWYIPYETINKKVDKLHNDRMPVELPERCIKLSGIKKESVVLDCFAGSFSTQLAAKKLGMNYIGSELNPENWKIGNNRLNNYVSK